MSDPMGSAPKVRGTSPSEVVFLVLYHNPPPSASNFAAMFLKPLRPQLSSTYRCCASESLPVFFTPEGSIQIRTGSILVCLAGDFSPFFSSADAKLLPGQDSTSRWEALPALLLYILLS